MIQQPEDERGQRLREHYRAELIRVAHIPAAEREAELGTVREIAEARRRAAA